MTGILFGPISVRVAVNSVCSSGAAATSAAPPPGGRCSRGSSRSSGGDAVALLEALDELGQLEDGHLVDRFEQIVLGQDSHGMFLLRRVDSVEFEWAALRAGVGSLLVGDLLQGVAQVAQRGGEQAGERTHRGLHPTGQLGQQDVARRERGEPRDVVRSDRLVAEDARR